MAASADTVIIPFRPHTAAPPHTMIAIHPLPHFDPARFVALASGHTTTTAVYRHTNHHLGPDGTVPLFMKRPLT